MHIFSIGIKVKKAVEIPIKITKTLKTQKNKCFGERSTERGRAAILTMEQPNRHKVCLIVISKSAKLNYARKAPNELHAFVTFMIISAIYVLSLHHNKHPFTRWMRTALNVPGVVNRVTVGRPSWLARAVVYQFQMMSTRQPVWNRPSTVTAGVHVVGSVPNRDNEQRCLERMRSLA